MQIKAPYFTKTSAVLFATLILFTITWAGSYINWKLGINQLKVNSEQQLKQFADHLDARLARFQFIPQLISKNMILVDLLRDPHSSPRKDIVNHYLEEINTIIGASDTYLMDAQGLTLAASNWLDEQTFNNKNFSFRPYFIDAMNGKTGRYFALGSTSAKRGYYFAYPIRYASQILGVIVVKMDLSNIEQNWSNRKIQFIVSDPHGITFITTQSQWLYHSIRPLSKQSLEEIHRSQRYNGIDIKIMDLHKIRSISHDSSIVKIKQTEHATREYFTIRKNMPQAGWNIMILAPLTELRKNQLTTSIVLFLIVILFILISFLILQRVRRQHEKQHFQQEAQKQLEQQVAVRTTDLTREIEEHKRTEKILRETQDELIQTAKLAVLGQMSASISHELNNPLAAIQSYTDNARKFLSMNNYTQVDENLYRIIQLSKRMSKISSQLKFFSRKSNQNMEVVSIQKVLKSAIDIISHKYKHSSSAIKIQSHIADLKVRADIIQLEQILINLINNAMQAIEKQNQGEVIINIEQKNEWALIHVDDNGQGIDLKYIDKIFEPFFTTKKSGLGLGLSISARIMDIMNGSLSVCNLPSGGARFSISLLVAEQQT